MTTYTVLRPFGDHKTGDTLSVEDFVSVQRVRQMVDQRYLTAMAEVVEETTTADGSGEDAPKRRGRKKASNE